MSRILYVFPHPDDESFGPAPGIAHHIDQGHEVHLLTLTKGGATRMRHKFGYTVDEMGAVRSKELRAVADVLGIESLKILDFPDSGLKTLDPRILENAISTHIDSVRPSIVVSYAAYGVSGFHDHLVTHAVVKRAFCEMQESRIWLRRLAFFTLANIDKASGLHVLQTSKPEEIQVQLHVNESHMQKFHRSLDCYETYAEVIQGSNVRELVSNTVSYELFQERHEHILTSIDAELP